MSSAFITYPKGHTFSKAYRLNCISYIMKNPYDLQTLAFVPLSYALRKSAQKNWLDLRRKETDSWANFRPYSASLLITQIKFSSQGQFQSHPNRQPEM